MPPKKMSLNNVMERSIHFDPSLMQPLHTLLDRVPIKKRPGFECKVKSVWIIHPAITTTLTIIRKLSKMEQSMGLLLVPKKDQPHMRRAMENSSSREGGLDGYPLAHFHSKRDNSKKALQLKDFPYRGSKVQTPCLQTAPLDDNQLDDNVEGVTDRTEMSHLTSKGGNLQGRSSVKYVSCRDVQDRSNMPHLFSKRGNLEERSQVKNVSIGGDVQDRSEMPHLPSKRVNLQKRSLEKDVSIIGDVQDRSEMPHLPSKRVNPQSLEKDVSIIGDVQDRNEMPHLPSKRVNPQSLEKDVSIRGGNFLFQYIFSNVNITRCSLIDFQDRSEMPHLPSKRVNLKSLDKDVSIRGGLHDRIQMSCISSKSGNPCDTIQVENLSSCRDAHSRSHGRCFVSRRHVHDVSFRGGSMQSQAHMEGTEIDDTFLDDNEEDATSPLENAIIDDIEEGSQIGRQIHIENVQSLNDVSPSNFDPVHLNAEKRKRGTTKLQSVAPRNGKKHQCIVRRVPVGEGRRKLSNYLGIMARDSHYSPLDKWWGRAHEIGFEKIMVDIREKLERRCIERGMEHTKDPLEFIPAMDDTFGQHRGGWERGFGAGISRRLLRDEATINVTNKDAHDNLQIQIQDKDREILDKDREIQDKDREIQEKDRMIANLLAQLNHQCGQFERSGPSTTYDQTPQVLRRTRCYPSPV